MDVNYKFKDHHYYKVYEEYVEDDDPFYWVEKRVNELEWDWSGGKPVTFDFQNLEDALWYWIVWD